MITTVKPHYLLFCEGKAGPGFGFPEDDASRWRFVLENVETGHKIEAWDQEEILHPDRISLMAVIRGLEALDQPSKVTLVTTNRYVARGLQYGLVEWRENDFCWEHFGSIQPIRNQDLWRRVDVALKYHEVTCRWMAYDAQQDHIDGDRRDVPVETLGATTCDRSSKKDSVSEQSRSRCRSFAAMNHISSPSDFPKALSDPNLGFNPMAQRDAFAEVLPQTEKNRSILLHLPRLWIWNCILCVDRVLVDAFKSMLMIDPSPDSYRARQ
jgi:ribonuclease HI